MILYYVILCCEGLESSALAHKAAVSAAMAGDARLALAIAAFLVFRGNHLSYTTCLTLIV